MSCGKIVPQTFQVAYYNGSTTVTANPTVSVSNYQYEEQLNAKKERIQVVRPTVIEEFVNIYYQLLTKGALALYKLVVRYQIYPCNKKDPRRVCKVPLYSLLFSHLLQVVQSMITYHLLLDLQ